MTGTLYICATPIGNLEDITLRVLTVLSKVDLIACEDTRVSAKLLSHYDIHTKTTAYHEHNRRVKGEKLILLLQEGKDIALISDAGMPIISDPGEDLVKRCALEGIPVTVLPGASAGITALALSGLSARRYVFEGFLPKQGKERKEILLRLQDESRTVVFYEAPHRLVKTLEDLCEMWPNRRIAIVRELTKRFEEKDVCTLSEAVEKYQTKEPRGEYVLVVEALSLQEVQKDSIKKWENIPLSEHMRQYTKQGYDKKEAMKQVAKDLGKTKREIYALCLELEEGLEDKS